MKVQKVHLHKLREVLSLEHNEAKHSIGSMLNDLLSGLGKKADLLFCDTCDQSFEEPYALKYGNILYNLGHRQRLVILLLHPLDTIVPFEGRWYKLEDKETIEIKPHEIEFYKSRLTGFHLRKSKAAFKKLLEEKLRQYEKDLAIVVADDDLAVYYKADGVLRRPITDYSVDKVLAKLKLDL